MIFTITIILRFFATRIYNNCRECLILCFVGFLVRTKCIRQGIFTFCSCLDEACCVNRGLRNRASWRLLSILTSTYLIWSHLMVTCFPWSMKVLSGWVQSIHAKCGNTTLLQYVSIYLYQLCSVLLWGLYLKPKVVNIFFSLLSEKECYLENDQTSLYHTAKGLMTLQALYGTIPQICGKGDCARVSALLTVDPGRCICTSK